MDAFGFTWTHLDVKWMIHLDALEFIRSHLDSLGLTCAHISGNKRGGYFLKTTISVGSFPS